MQQKETEELDSQMSFLDHLDELRRRLINSVVIIIIAFIFCWFVSGYIFDFLSVPIRRALSESQRRDLPLEGISGEEAVKPLSTIKAGESVRYIFGKTTNLGPSVVNPGTSVNAVAELDGNGNLGLFTAEPVVAGNSLIPKGIRLPVDLTAQPDSEPSIEEQLVVTTTVEGFTLHVTVALYAAIALSVPLLLIQVWGFISPALYKHEKAYVTPFVLLSSISFVAGAAFAYYILFPPAVNYLLSLAEEFRPLLRATDYFEFITLIMLAMGAIFQMPAITYVLARIGLISSGLLIKSWKLAIVVILIVAAVVSPTGDIPNLMLFASPMMVLYVFSIFIAWLFGKKRSENK